MEASRIRALVACSPRTIVFKPTDVVEALNLRASGNRISRLPAGYDLITC